MPHVCFPSTSRHLARRSQEKIIQRWFHRFISVDPFPAEMCLLILCRVQEIATLNALNALETGQIVAFCPQSVCINWKHNHPNVVWSIYIGPIRAETGSSYAGLECGKLPPWMHQKFVKLCWDDDFSGFYSPDTKLWTETTLWITKVGAFKAFKVAVCHILTLQKIDTSRKWTEVNFKLIKVCLDDCFPGFYHLLTWLWTQNSHLTHVWCIKSISTYLNWQPSAF